MSSSAFAGPLSDLTLFESNAPGTPLCLRIANGFAARLAADLGARVVKLEPANGDLVRTCAPLLRGGRSDAQSVSALFEFLNCGKSILRLPPDAQEAQNRLLNSSVDGVFGEQGDPFLDAARSRGIPTVEITGFADGAGDRQTVMSEFAALALSGLLDMVGSPDREPLRLGGHQAAYAAGMSAFTAMCALAVGRDLGLPADSARVSMVETALWINWKAMAAAQASGRANSRKGAQAEFQVLRCLDGWVALVFAPTQFDAVIALVGDPALTQPQFQTVSGRAAHRTELFEVLGPWFAQRRVLDIYSQGQALGVPLGPVLDAADLLDDPQYLAREFITTLPHATLGELKMPRLPVLWGDRIPRPLARTDASLETLVSELNRA